MLCMHGDAYRCLECFGNALGILVDALGCMAFLVIILRMARDVSSFLGVFGRMDIL